MQDAIEDAVFMKEELSEIFGTLPNELKIEWQNYIEIKCNPGSRMIVDAFSKKQPNKEILLHVVKSRRIDAE